MGCCANGKDLKAENDRLRAENEALRAELAWAKENLAHMGVALFHFQRDRDAIKGSRGP